MHVSCNHQQSIQLHSLCSEVRLKVAYYVTYTYMHTYTRTHTYSPHTNVPRWLKPLQELLEEINNRFGRYFSQMGCAGEVSLLSDENVREAVVFYLVPKRLKLLCL